MILEKKGLDIKKEIKKLTILIVEDDDDCFMLIQNRLYARGFSKILRTRTGTETMEILKNIYRDVGVILLDLILPDSQELELYSNIIKRYNIPVIIVTARKEKELIIKALEMGAEDFIEKPFDPDILTLRVEKTISEAYLTKKLEQSSFRNKRLFLNVLQVMAKILETKDPYTQFHSENVAKYARRIAKKLGFDKEQVEALGIAGILHDFGKIGIQESILNKRGPLTEAEYEIIKRHPIIAATILQPIAEFRTIINDIKYHHEKFDGSGYPEGLKGSQIPLGARILAIVDAYDAMTSGRPYRPARSTEEAIEELKKGAGTHFDPQLVEIFIEVLEDEKKDISFFEEEEEE